MRIGPATKPDPPARPDLGWLLHLARDEHPDDPTAERRMFLGLALQHGYITERCGFTWAGNRCRRALHDDDDHDFQDRRLTPGGPIPVPIRPEAEWLPTITSCSRTAALSGSTATPRPAPVAPGPGGPSTASATPPSSTASTSAR